MLQFLRVIVPDFYTKEAMAFFPSPPDYSCDLSEEEYPIRVMEWFRFPEKFPEEPADYPFPCCGCIRRAIPDVPCDAEVFVHVGDAYASAPTTFDGWLPAVRICFDRNAHQNDYEELLAYDKVLLRFKEVLHKGPPLQDEEKSESVEPGEG